MKSTVIAALFASAAAIKLDPFLSKINGALAPTEPLAFHENEDPNSVPNPMTNRYYMTSTQAKLISKDQTDLSAEPNDLAPQFREQYNAFAPEPVGKKYLDAAGPSLVQLGSDVQTLEDSDAPEDEMTVLWMVDADYGENDHVVVGREQDTGNGIKHSGWNNPLAWTDDGNDDDLILTQRKSSLRFSEPSLVQLREDDDDDSVPNEEEVRTAE